VSRKQVSARCAFKIVQNVKTARSVKLACKIILSTVILRNVVASMESMRTRLHQLACLATKIVPFVTTAIHVHNATRDSRSHKMAPAKSFAIPGSSTIVRLKNAINAWTIAMTVST